MKQHSAKELMYKATVLDNDGVTVLASGIGAGITDDTGSPEDQSQLEAAQTTHVILLRHADAGAVKDSSFITINGDPARYIVIYRQDPRKPRARVWMEVYCRVVRVDA